MRSPLPVLLLALLAALLLWLFLAIWPDWLVALIGPKKLFVSTIFNGVTLAGLYFLVASGFTLVFGLMRNVNLAHGSLYLFGAYIGFEVARWTGLWLLGVAAGFLAAAAVGALMQIFVFRRMEGDDLRQTLVTIGISIVAADLMLAVWSGKTYQFTIPEWLDGAVVTPIVLALRSNGDAVPMAYPFFRLVVLAAAVVIGIALVARHPPDPHRHDDPRGRRRPRHAFGDRRQRARPLRHRLRHRRGAGGLCRRHRRDGALHRAGRGRALSARLARRRHRRRHGLASPALRSARS